MLTKFCSCASHAYTHSNWLVLAIVSIGGTPVPTRAQTLTSLTLLEAKAAARRTSPELRAAREGVIAARGRERQAGVRQNPTFAFGREQSSGGGQSNSQNIAWLELPFEPSGLRSARRDAAAARREAAEARVTVAESQLDFEVTRAYAVALAADRRAALSEQATAAFTEALRVSERRYAAGDLSGYANRRLKLESARYATLRSEASLAQRSARTELASLVAPDANAIGPLGLTLADSLTLQISMSGSDSLLSVALRSRGELRVAILEAEAAAADARLAVRERTPVPLLSAGLKTERLSISSAASQGLKGFAAGFAIPLPLWDRRVGAIEAADADSRQRAAEIELQRRRIAREVAEAFDAYRAADAQIALLAPQLGVESRAALRAAQVAYAEGEITLAEWLDAVRAYREAEASFVALQAELMIRHAALNRAIGAPSPATLTGSDR